MVAFMVHFKLQNLAVGEFIFVKLVASILCPSTQMPGPDTGVTSHPFMR